MKYVSDYKELENKKFETEQELLAAEKELEAQKAQKEKQSEKIRKEAAVVSVAFKEYNKEKEHANEVKAAARKAYYEAVKAANEKFEEVVQAAEDEVEKKNKIFGEELKKFQDAHPEGYHLTLKNGDLVQVEPKEHSDFVKQFRQINRSFDQAISDILSYFFK